jgi:hypothetical protein
MKENIEENNRLRNGQLGNRNVSDLTKREHIAALTLQGLLANNKTRSDEEIVNKAVRLADLLVAKLNEN